MAYSISLLCEQELIRNTNINEIKSSFVILQRNIVFIEYRK